MQISIHTQLTKEAIKKKISSATLKLICRGNEDSDQLINLVSFSTEASKSAQHFSDAPLKQGLKFVERAESMACDYFHRSTSPDAAPEERKRRLVHALYITGRLMHAIQDFYAHTNWIHLTGDRKIIWNESFKHPNLPDKLPAHYKLKNCYYRFITEITDRARGLKCKNYEEMFLEEDPSKKQISHTFFSNDYNESYSSDAFQSIHKGRSGFEVACINARTHTRLKWAKIQRKLKDTMGKERYKVLEESLQNLDLTFKEIEDIIKSSRTKFENNMRILFKEDPSVIAEET